MSFRKDLLPDPEINTDTLFYEILAMTRRPSTHRFFFLHKRTIHHLAHTFHLFFISSPTGFIFKRMKFSIPLSFVLSGLLAEGFVPTRPSVPIHQHQASVLNVKTHLFSHTPFNSNDNSPRQELSEKAMTYCSEGKYDKAEPLFLECIKQSKETFGDDHIETLTFMHNLANTKYAQGSLDEAENLLSKSLSRCMKIFGVDHRYNLKMMEDLAYVYFSQGRFEEAEPLFDECVRRNKIHNGHDHPATLEHMFTLALSKYRQDNYDEAEELLRIVIDEQKRVLGQNNPDTLETLISLADLHFAKGEYKQSEPLLVEYVKQSRVVYGEEHDDTLYGEDFLAEVRTRLYQQRSEKQSHNIVVTPLNHVELDAIDVDDDFDMETFENIEELARLYSVEGKYYNAIPLFTKILAKNKASLGEDHPDTLESMVEVALCYSATSNWEVAEEMFLECKEKHVLVFGEAYPDTKIIDDYITMVRDSKRE